MEDLKKKRTTLRGRLTRHITRLEGMLTQEPMDIDDVSACLQLAEVINQEVSDVSEEYMELMENSEDVDVDAVEVEIEANMEYTRKFLKIKSKAERKMQPEASEAGSFSSARQGNASDDLRKTYDLPKVKLREFNGELKEWLGFWSQFQRIHDDPDMSVDRKFTYLDMAMVKGSRAQVVLDCYKKIPENYPKAIEALKSRFGREDLQVEVYIRELLKLVVVNVNQQQKDKMGLTKLYDQLESQLRALESLGVASDKHDAMLVPMVESCLPIPVLRIWERSPMSRKPRTDPGQKTNPDAKTKLQNLMEFLRNEVESEERISLASEGFGMKEAKPELSNNQKKLTGKVRRSEDRRTPTAAGLANEVERQSCVFCSGSHSSELCNSAKDMTWQERREKLRKAGCCFNCLKKGCWTKDCKAKVLCYNCGKSHHTLMCSGQNRNGHERKSREADSEPETEGARATNTTPNACVVPDEVFLQTAIIELVNGKKRKKVRALFDSGSQTSHLKASTIQELGYERKGTEVLEHILFGGTRKQVVHGQYDVLITRNNSSQPMKLGLLDQEVICGKLPCVKKGQWMSELREKGIWIADVGGGSREIEMLIGGDWYGRFLTNQVEQLPCGLTAVKTIVGWTVMGAFNQQQPQPDGIKSPRRNHSMVCSSMAVSQMSIPDLWKLEAIGIQDPIEVKQQQEEEADVLRKFEETVKQGPEGRYIVKLPWRRDVPDLPTNRGVAEKRLNSATRKLKTSGYEAYDKVFQEWLDEGIIEEIPEDGSSRCHYLPHRAVIKEESATTKVRPVFDASCKTGRAPSLNDCLEKGPNMIDLIPAVMTRFREGSIGVISDIRKAFLMIEVAEEDRDFLRFLWWETPECKKIKVYRHKRVVFGVSSSPFLLAAVIRHHLMKYQDVRKDVAMKLLLSLYVDNCVASVSSQEELERFVDVSTEMMKEAGMDLRLWQDSSSVSVEMDDRVVPVLGMKWDRFLDVLYCDTPAAEVNPENVTKRNILSLAQKLFDPLGIISPVTVQPKLLLQEAWAQKKGWDEVVEDDAKNRFLRWTDDLPQLDKIQVPRNVVGSSEDTTGWSLHCFTDASSYAYGAVVFLRREGNPVTVQLLQAKARVAPLKTATIPRLELLGCLIGARLTTAVIAAAWNLQNVPRYFWTDSSTALSWIRRNDDWGTFVGNRVREILSLTDAQEWNHVPGRMNPADLPSRGCLPQELLTSTWWEGPAWLLLDQQEWPPIAESEAVDEAEVIREKRKSVATNLATGAPEPPWYLRGRSGYAHTIRRASYVYRFIEKLRKREKFTGELTVAELQETEKRLALAVQAEAFPEVDCFKKLGVFRDGEGLLRVKTKLLMRQDKADFKTPILLPTYHPFVTELVREEHLRNGHAGAGVLISILRERFWIVHTRKAIKNVIRNCQRCKRFNARNVEVEAAALPEDRVRDAAPFEIVGIDLAGPLFLRDKKKAWIVLFTCAVYRAVHLELVTSMDTGNYLQALRRYIARRGRPSVIYSDNGTNFRGAENMMKALDWDLIGKKFAAARIQWKFSPPSAPWWGGFWERMVRSVKELLVRILGRSSVNFEELATILCDVESIINQRPLTVMTEDDDDLVALTPAMFLQGVREAGVPELDILDMEAMKKRFRYRQELVTELRSRFRTEYLANLLQRSQQQTNYELRVGDLVLIGEDFKKRQEWQLGRIVELIRRRGATRGPARVAVVRTPKGICERPVRRLFPMELNPMDEEQEVEAQVFTRRGRKIKKPERFV